VAAGSVRWPPDARGGPAPLVPAPSVTHGLHDLCVLVRRRGGFLRRRLPNPDGQRVVDVDGGHDFGTWPRSTMAMLGCGSVTQRCGEFERGTMQRQSAPAWRPQIRRRRIAALPGHICVPSAHDAREPPADRRVAGRRRRPGRSSADSSASGCPLARAAATAHSARWLGCQARRRPPPAGVPRPGRSTRFAD
jgi:hypothetical protein